MELACGQDHAIQIAAFRALGPKHSRDQNKINDFNAAIKAI
jgi:hypothetical protein